MRFGAGFWGPFPLRRYVEYAIIPVRREPSMASPRR